MKTKMFFVFFSILIFSPFFVSATVDGPTTVNEFKYNPANESIYYVVNSYSGRGCPPMLYKIGLESEKNDVVYSCTEGEEFLQGNPQSNVYTQFNEITNGFKFMSPIHLKNNNIAIDVNYIGEGETNPVALSKKIEVVIYQNGSKIDQFQTTACNLEQPFIFEGYDIPGFEKKIMLLMSAKRNCNEGGYIVETLHIINNINNLDKTRRTNFFKTQNELAPDESSLIVFESDTIKNEVKIPDDNDQDLNKDGGNSEVVKEKLNKQVDYSKASLFSALSLVLGLILGSLMGRKL